MKGLFYKGDRLAPGSDALAMWQRGEYKKLDAHLKAVHEAAVKRGEILEPPARAKRIFEPCCDNERRTMAGGCANCGDPCL